MSKNLINGLFSSISDAELAAMAMQADFETDAVSAGTDAGQSNEAGSNQEPSSTAFHAAGPASSGVKPEKPSR